MFEIRTAKEGDAALVLDFIRKIARYERLEEQVVTDEATIHRSLFIERRAEVVIAYNEGCPVGFALFFHNFSTFVGRAGLYLEDLFVDEQYRGMGFGKALFLHLVATAQERNCGRMEWTALNWNQSAINFYNAMGARAMSEWTTFRLEEKEFIDTLKR